MSIGRSIFIAGVLAILCSGQALAFGAKAPSPQPSPAASGQPKTIVRLDPIQDVVISLPSAVDPLSTTVESPTYDFGPNLVSSLANQMINSHYILDQPESQPLALQAKSAAPAPSITPLPNWDGSNVVPAAEFKFYVDALNLRTGDRGDEMYYGFDERFKTPFNNGNPTDLNEFPLSQVTFQPNWFDRTFDDQGNAPFDSQSGLDLGQGFTLSALVAWVAVKYADYHSTIRMRVEMLAPLAGRHEIKSIEVKGGGYYFDVVGGYEQWSGGIGLARTDAMSAAFQNAFAGAYSTIDAWVKNLPLTAVYYGTSGGQILLNTGKNSNIPIGTKYASVDHPGLIVEVIADVPASSGFYNGSLGKLDSGDLSELQSGMVFVQQTGATEPASVSSHALAQASSTPTPVAAASVTLPGANLPESNFSASSATQVPTESWVDALWLSITQGWALPYRIWRYFQYDESYKGGDGGTTSASQLRHTDALAPAYAGPDLSKNDAQDPSSAQGAEDWANQVKGQPFAHQIGLDVAPAMTEEGPVVAIIDGGVDYNHPALRDRIWKNPTPVTDPDGNTDEFGWDFISGDSRPYDDGYHGTEVASAVLGVAPLAQIMPLKVFNPFGVTSSAAIYAAFRYAVDHGAQIIVAGWATRLETQTLQMAVQYAHDHGVLVVTSAGDHGDDLSKTPAYPASLSTVFDNVVTVAGVNSSDQIVQVNGFYSSYGSEAVTIAAPGESILVAQPRNHTSSQTTSGIAAGLVAGAIARDVADEGSGASDYHAWIEELKSQADVVPGLANSVAGGLRLHVK